ERSLEVDRASLRGETDLGTGEFSIRGEFQKRSVGDETAAGHERVPEVLPGQLARTEEKVAARRPDQARPVQVRDRVLAAGHRHLEAAVERVVPDDQSAPPGRRPQLQVLEAAERQVDRKPARYREVSLDRVALGPGEIGR